LTLDPGPELSQGPRDRRVPWHAMPVCPACREWNPEGYRFCGQCGKTLDSSRCASCGASNPVGQHFCGQCGSALGEGTEADRRRHPITTSEPETEVGERKLATVLFADVVGFTSLAERTDHELVARMVDSAFRELGDVVAEHGGTVDKYMGDSLMAVFGVPVAHDDDAERAIATAFAMRQVGGDLVFSIGINSGEVMVGTVGRGDVTVIGDTVNVAARLEKAAAPGEVLCGRLTAELAREKVTFRERQQLLVKGKSEPVEVFEAVRLSDSGAFRSREEVAFVGRETELAFLEGHWRRAREERKFQLVLVCGEAGSGKTRLLDELSRVVGGQSAVVRASYPGYGAMGGARLASDIIAQLGPLGDPEVDNRVRSLSGEVDESLRSIDPVAMQHEQMWAFGRLLKEKARDGTLVVVVDDVHRSDERTLGLLAEMSTRLSEVSLLTVLSGRTEPSAWLSRFPTATTLRIPALSRRDAGTLIDAFVRDKPMDPEASKLLVDTTAGNPLYLRELLSMARAKGMLVDDGTCYRLRAREGIPATLRALLAARLDSLPVGHKQVLQHASVLGEPTAEQLVALGLEPSPESLQTLVASGFLAHAPEGRYQTVDPLLREVAYEMLPRNVRGELHRKAAQVVSRPEDRARHLDRAARYLADDDKVAADAAEALVAVGLEFSDASRHSDAMRLLERAVALGSREPSVLVELARIQTMLSKEDEALATLSLVEDDPADPAVAVERDHTAASAKLFTDPAWALPRLEDAAARWRALDNPNKEAWALANGGVAKFNLSQLDAAESDLEEALRLFEEVGDRNGAVAASSFLCLVKPADPRVPTWLTQALDFAEQSGDRTKKVSILASAAWRNFMRSMAGSVADMAEAEEAASRLAELSEELGVTDTALHGWSMLTIMARQTGRLDEAEAHSLSLERAAGGPNHYGSWISWAASFAVAVARGSTGAAPPFPPGDSPDPVAAVASLVIALELIMSGRADEALDRFDAVGPPALEGPLADLGGFVYAMALILRGRGAQAEPWLRKAHRAALALDSKPVLLATSALRAELEGRRPESAPALGSPESIADALALRAHALSGDVDASESLAKLCRALVSPGFLPGVPRLR
jgi:class 3 adenylate cyclase/tetratricopeptide (TPR) repeat protein